MNKNELIVAAAKRLEVSQREVRLSVSAFLDCFIDAINNGENVTIEGLGSFVIKERKGYKVNFSLKQQEYVIKPKKVVKYRPSSKIMIK